MVILVVDEKQNENLKILEFGILDSKLKKGWGPGVREYYMVHFILDGEGYFNGQLLKKGNFFTSKPYQKIHYFPKPNNEWHYVWFLLKGDGVEDFLSEYGLYPETGVGKYCGVEEITKLCNNFFTKEVATINGETAINWAKLMCSFNRLLCINSCFKIAIRDSIPLDFIKSCYNQCVWSKLRLKNRKEYIYELFT